MKEILLLSVLTLVAGTALAGEVPPYGELYAFNTLFQQIPESAESTEKQIKIFPNPVTEGRLTIKSSESFNAVQILNITGEIVLNLEFPAGTNSEVIELINLEKGMYLVRIGFNGKPNYTAKIIIK